MYNRRRSRRRCIRAFLLVMKERRIQVEGLNAKSFRIKFRSWERINLSMKVK